MRKHTKQALPVLISHETNARSTWPIRNSSVLWSPFQLTDKKMEKAEGARYADEGDFCEIRADIVSEIATQQLFKRTFILSIISVSAFESVGSFQCLFHFLAFVRINSLSFI